MMKQNMFTWSIVVFFEQCIPTIFVKVKSKFKVFCTVHE